MNEQTKNYIDSQRKSGISDAQIKTILMSQGGWSEGDLDVYFSQTNLNNQNQLLSMPQKKYTDESMNIYSEINKNKKSVVKFFVWIILLNIVSDLFFDLYDTSLFTLSKKIAFFVPIFSILIYFSISLTKKIVKTFKLQSLLDNEVNSQEKSIARKRMFITGFLCLTFTLSMLRMIVFVFNHLIK
jgi:hypothetical protein